MNYDDQNPTLTTPAETADYIRDMTTGLATMARRAHLNTLAYLLDMAAMEAGQNAMPPRGAVANSR